jgi:hypothetical protein
VDDQGLWKLIEAARGQARDLADAEAVAARAATLLRARPPGEIVAADEVLWRLMADSYRNPLWAAAYLVNGGCSDDGFEYFRGWLIMQGREVYERVVADPDALAGLAAIRAMAPGGRPVECEDTLYIAGRAYRAATGGELPGVRSGPNYPGLDPGWDFDDRAEMARRLPRLAALFPGFQGIFPCRLDHGPASWRRRRARWRNQRALAWWRRRRQRPAQVLADGLPGTGDQAEDPLDLGDGQRDQPQVPR